MRKTSYKFRPASYWYIRQYEQWFAQLASQGLHVKGMSTGFVKFERGEPQQVTYRIALTQHKAPNDKQIALYEEHGWQYVTSHQYFHVFKGVHAQDVLEDAEAQRYKYEQLKEKQRTSIYLLAFCLLVYSALLAALWLMGGTPILRLVEGTVMTQTLLAVVLLYNVAEPMQAIRQIGRFEQSMDSGGKMPQLTWQACWRKHRIRTWGIFLFALLGMVLPIIQLTKMTHMDMPTEDIPVTFLSVTALGEVTPHSPSYYSTSWGILAPVQYYVRESGTVIVPTRGEQEVSAETKVYKVRPQLLATPLVHDVMKWHSYEEAPSFVKQTHPQFDSLFVREDGEKREVVAAKGAEVIYVRYFGDVPLNELVRQVEQTFH